MLAPYQFAVPVRIRTMSTPHQSAPRPAPEPLPLEQPSSVSLASSSQTTLQTKHQNHSSVSIVSAVPLRSPSLKILRPKRPSSANTALQAKHDFPVAHHPPERPPRNPARVALPSRPSTSSGVTRSDASHTTNTRPSPAFQVLGCTSPAMPGGRALPTSRSEFGVQRQKSKSSKGGSSQTDKESAKNNVQFSTVDRTILEGLRQKIHARESQFIVRNGKKHHSLSATVAQYPRSYEREVVDHDVWNTMWMQQLCGSVTMHVFETDPARVLDVGCGTGTWILDAARQWKNSYFFGLDIVPLHPDLVQVGSADLASRITWVQANFLEGLPFPNEEFDMVRVAWTARGVPEDKWDALFEEFVRVMKPGAAFELLEEDLYFPGKARDRLSPTSSPFNSPVSSPTSPLARPRAPTPSSSYHSSDHSSFENLSTTSKSSLPSRDSAARSPPVTPNAALMFGAQPRFHAFAKPPLNPHDHSVLEHIYNEMHAARFINLQPLSLLSNLSNIYFKDVRTHQPLITMFPPLPTAGRQSITPKDSYTPDYRSSTDSLTDSTETSAAFDPKLPVDDVHRCSISHPELGDATRGAEGVDLRLDLDEYVKVDNTRVPFVLRPHRSTGASQATRFRSSNTARKEIPDYSSDHGVVACSMDDLQHGARLSELPNNTVRFDLRTLNMHLSLKVREVLACAEAMWDFVVDLQTPHVAQETVRSARPSRVADAWKSRGRLTATQAVISPVATNPVNAVNAVLMHMTRNDFEELLARFELDMYDSMGLDVVVRDRLGWAPVAASRTQARKEFDTMCRVWETYQDELASHGPAHSTHSNAHGDGASAKHDGPPHPEGDGSAENGMSFDTNGPSTDHHAPPRRPHGTPPSDRLSRTIRIFAAWKA